MTLDLSKMITILVEYYYNILQVYQHCLWLPPHRFVFKVLCTFQTNIIRTAVSAESRIQGKTIILPSCDAGGNAALAIL